jgi:protein-S-isoprenylcysteine O-methyltransferase Ste14
MDNLLGDSTLAILVLSINLVAIMCDTYMLCHPRLLQQFKKLPSCIQKLAVMFVVVPLFVSTVVPQLRFDVPSGVTLPLGGILMATGVALVCAAFAKIGIIPSVRIKSNVVTTGVYGLMRHPIYSGTLLAFLGLSFAFRALIPLLYWPIAVVLYLVLIPAEEQVLVAEYGEEYATYQSRVKGRLMPSIL